MATTEILLLEPINGLGVEGESVKVKAGYARNFLLPRKKAVPITQTNRKQLEALLKRRRIRESDELDKAKSQAAAISETSLTFTVKTGETGKMFGALTAKDIVDRLAETADIHLNKKQLHLATPLKTLGQHTLTVKVHSEVSADLKFEIVSETTDQTEGETTEAASANEEPAGKSEKN